MKVYLCRCIAFLLVTTGTMNAQCDPNWIYTYLATDYTEKPGDPIRPGQTRCTQDPLNEQYEINKFLGTQICLDKLTMSLGARAYRILCKRRYVI